MAFDSLKTAMVSAPILALPNFNVEFVVEADVSNMGIWVVLTQGGRPVAYFSKALGEKQRLFQYMKKRCWPS